jgi:hypothetical protein
MAARYEEKGETMLMVKRLMAKIADVWKDYPVLVVVRNNAGENTSKGLSDYFTECGVKNKFSSTPYEQWQIRLAEASVNSVNMIGKFVMAESGLGRTLWFCATMHGVN